MNDPALVIAVVSLALSVSAFVWQIVNYLLTGARIKVELVPGGVLWAPGQPHEKVLRIIVRNIGRQAVSVTSVSLLRDDDISLFFLRPNSINRQLPVTVEAGHDFNYFLDRGPVEDDVRERGVPSMRVRAQVSLATGKTIKSKKKISPTISA